MWLSYTLYAGLLTAIGLPLIALSDRKLTTGCRRWWLPASILFAVASIGFVNHGYHRFVDFNMTSAREGTLDDLKRMENVFDRFPDRVKQWGAAPSAHRFLCVDGKIVYVAPDSEEIRRLGSPILDICQPVSGIIVLADEPFWKSPEYWLAYRGDRIRLSRIEGEVRESAFAWPQLLLLLPIWVMGMYVARFFQEFVTSISGRKHLWVAVYLLTCLLVGTFSFHASISKMCLTQANRSKSEWTDSVRNRCRGDARCMRKDLNANHDFEEYTGSTQRAGKKADVIMKIIDAGLLVYRVKTTGSILVVSVDRTFVVDGS